MSRRCAALATALGLALTAKAHSATLALEVMINGQSTGKIATVEQRAGALFMDAKEFSDFGLVISAGAMADEIDLITVSGLTARIDDRMQRLYITAADADLRPTRLNVAARPAALDHDESGTGALIDYDIVGAYSRAGPAFSSLFDARAFSPLGVASVSFLDDAASSAANRVVRLDSTFVVTDVEHLKQYVIGDVISGGLSWTRPVRLGGAQIQSDFALQPWLVTFPTPSLQGSAAVPSTVDVLVNGSRAISQAVPPGPFQIAGPPVIAGANALTVRVTDALGRQTSVEMPYYASANLLAEGLRSYSFEVGAVRLRYGLASDDYGIAAAVATWRGGLSDRVTVEAHGETAEGMVLAGGGATMRIGELGEVDLDAAASRSFDQTGTLAHMGLQRLGRRLSFGVDLTLASRDYRDLAALEGDATPRRQLTVNLGYAFKGAGSFQFAYVDVVRERAGASVVPPVDVRGISGASPGGERARLVSAGYSFQLRRTSIYLTGYNDFAQRSACGLMLGLTLALGRASVGANVGTYAGQGSVQAQASRSASDVGDVGYQVYASDGAESQAFAEASYRAQWATLSAGLDRTGRETAARFEARGSVSFIDGRTFAANAIEDAFAVIDTGGYARVKVYDDNRLIGITGHSGQLIAPDLRAYDTNHLSLDPDDLPPDAELTSAKLTITPRNRSGVVARFDVKPSRSALLRLVDESGAPVPVGSVATLGGSSEEVAVGYDGEAYVTGLSPFDRVEVSRSDGGRCTASFAYTPDSGGLPSIGPLTCEPVP